MKNSTNYGLIVKRARKEKGLSQEQLGKLIGVGKTCISNYETSYCEMSVSTLDQIAHALGYPLIYMLSKFGDNYGNDLDRKLVQSGKDVAIPFINAKEFDPGDENFSNVMDSFVTMPSSILGSGNFVFAKVKDEALKSDGISKNDCVFVRLEKAVKEKSIVLFINKKTNEYYIRKYIRDGHIVSMMPSVLNTEFAPIRYDERDSDYEILGTCVKILTNIN